MSDKPLFDRVALIGIGLIGSSLARVLRAKGLARRIAACARSEATRAKVLELGLAESVHADPGEAVAEADLVILCTPIGTYAAIAEAIAPRLKRGAIVSDVGSVKQAALRGLDMPLADGLKLERELFNFLMETEDSREGARAFAEKRNPQWQSK